MFALKANYGYRDNIQIIQSDGRDLLPEYSREEIAARAKVVDLLPDSPDDLPRLSPREPPKTSYIVRQ